MEKHSITALNLLLLTLAALSQLRKPHSYRKWHSRHNLLLKKRIVFYLLLMHRKAGLMQMKKYTAH